MIGYGVVGSGYFGAELARIMNTKPGAVIRAVHDPENGAAVAAELGCDAEGSLKALVSRKDIQAVIVATPNYLHKEPVLAAAAHGLNVFCEKPIALSYGDCREMVRACQDNHVIFMAGHVMNFFRGVRRAKELIGQGAIGDIRRAPVPPHPRTGLCAVPYGRLPGHRDHGWGQCGPQGGRLWG